MISRLNINNFKRISGPLEFRNLSRVNYLVGINGSGKSSVLQALICLKDSLSYEPYIKCFHEDCRIEAQIDINSAHFKNSIQGSSSSTPIEDLQTGIYLEEFKPFMLDPTGINTGFDLTLNKKENLSFINETFHEVTGDEISAKRQPRVDAWSPDGVLSFIQNDREIDPTLLADGYKALNTIRWYLSRILRSSIHFKNNQYVLLLEEPENHLHPSLQKNIPKLIDSMLKASGINENDNLHIVITTHSPFIISASAGLDGQKIYLMEGGQLLDAEGNPVPVSEGFSGAECRWIVGKMLGANVTDIGYPENYCILEESSLQRILSKCVKSGIIKNYQFISVGGESNVTKFSEELDHVREFENLNTLIKCNPYYGDKYLVLVDSTEGLNSKAKARLKSIETKLGGRYHELTGHGIEDYYPNLDSALHQSYLNEYRNAPDRSAKGLIKGRYAELVGDRITSRAELTKLFKGELDFLL